MPYDPRTPNLVGEYLLRGAEGLGAGLQQAGQNIGGMFQRRKDEEARKKEEDKQRSRMFDALVNYADASGAIPKDRAKTMSLEQLDGQMRGLVLKEEREREKSQQARVASVYRQLGLLAGDDPGMGPMTAGDQAAVNSRGVDLLTGRPKVDEAAIARVLIGNQAGDPAVLARMLLPKEQQATNSKRPPELIQRGGRDLIYSPDTGRYDFVPAAPAPKAAPTLTPGAKLTNRVAIKKQISDLQKEFTTADSARQRSIRQEIMDWQKDLQVLDAEGAKPSGTPAAAPKVPTEEERLIQEGNAAIAAGAPREEVIARLKARGIKLQ